MERFQRGCRVLKVPPLDYACPATIAEAVALLAAHNGDAKPIAGGQSLMPMLAFRVASPSLLVDLRQRVRDIRQGADGRGQEIPADSGNARRRLRGEHVDAHNPASRPRASDGNLSGGLADSRDKREGRQGRRKMARGDGRT